MLRVTQLYPAYKDRARLTEFSGYSMPLFFKGIIEESLAVRNSLGIFDVSHMGRFKLKGTGATGLLNRLLTADVNKVEVGKATYGFMCNERGGVIDDLITYKRGEDDFVLVVNCSNRSKDLEWIRKWAAGTPVLVQDVTDESVLVAVQGPRAVEALDDLGVSGIKRFRFSENEYMGKHALVARTGYTGEDGFEVMLEGVTVQEPEVALAFWAKLSEKIAPLGGLEAGLGARDTLRLEAGLPLHGNDISEEISPLEAGLGRFVDLSKRDYVGRKAHEAQFSSGTSRVLVGIVCQGNFIPRPHCRVFDGGKEVGHVTSGTYSPILRKCIAMALVESGSSRSEALEVEIRGNRCKAEISQMPFYDVSLYGFRRKKN